MKIDIISDVVCPWCYIGKKNLEAAMAQRPDIDFELQWFPYQLHPEAPLEGYNYIESIEKKYGKARFQMMFAQITQAGEASGIRLNLEGIERGANTLKAHRLLDVAFRKGGSALQNTLSESLFQAYFCDSRDIGDTEVLSTIAADIGLDKDKVSDYLNSDDGVTDVKKQINFSRQQGINSVPSFSIEGQFVLSGGQATAVFLSTIDRLAGC
ncbi:hypothetical protein A9Q88_03720 [Gammaproteobacteria bacterium 50_400_T64]|nr:hypothetical protein A9Q88_03720 [Gammaproteobacteria bacterium 50_400_T64]